MSEVKRSSWTTAGVLLPAVVALGFLAGCQAPGPSADQIAAQRAEQARIERARQRAIEQQQAQARLDAQRRAQAAKRQGPRTAAGLKEALKVGTYRCDLSRRVQVVQVTDNGNAAVLQWGRKQFAMTAVQSNTGALRLENKSAGLVWIGVVGKSMLLDTRRGKQLANDCKLVG